MYKITGILTGHYATKIKLRAHKTATGELAGEILLDPHNATSMAYQIDMPAGDNCYLVLLPDIGDGWHTGRRHAVGDTVYPSDFSAMPYYYICTGAGVVGQYEPVFSADPLKIIQDGECTWERVERIPYPLIQYPVTPELV